MSASDEAIARAPDAEARPEEPQPDPIAVAGPPTGPGGGEGGPGQPPEADRPEQALEPLGVVPLEPDDEPPSRTVSLSARTVGALAVVGVVVAFSLSSTLVKLAHAPGVLVAFWRMATVSVVWNAFLWATGRRVTMRDVRQALVPGIFFGLNLAAFFVGATNNSVANAALIGSLSPFLIVPLGAVLFREYIDVRALFFALVAFGGLVVVLFSAPSNGDASTKGNVFGIVAMFLWTAYVLSTRRFRQGMDVATFMATVSPIAAVAVLPLAIANGDVFAMGATGWTYMFLLTFVSGVAAQGLMVFAQKSIAIGTIGIAQVVQPALAVVWSFLLLGETVNRNQVIGIAIVLGGLLAFLVLNERGYRLHRRDAASGSGAAENLRA
jgi:drug/metabolite transporter (DMT)-like permease